MGGAVGGVRVTVLDHPEYGRTATQADGGYDLAVNGGGPLTLVFEREGYIPAQRVVDVPWQDYADVEPLVMVPYDPRATRIDTSGSNISAVQASTITDGSGTRTQTLLFAPGTTAQMEVGGALQPIGSAFTVRSTEFTQGANGVEAMPGQLPPATAYTYAAEFSLDEAAAAGATDVRFSKPVATYLDNFLEHAGRHARARRAGTTARPANGSARPTAASSSWSPAAWTPTATGPPTTPASTPPRWPSSRTLYPVGKELWRVEVTHFTPWDYNHPYGPADGAGPPGPGNGPRRPPDDPDNPCPEEGSIILCDDQVLGEELPITGTEQRLVYRSDRTPGRLAERTLPITLRNSAIDPSLRAIDLQIELAGRVIKLLVHAPRRPRPPARSTRTRGTAWTPTAAASTAPSR